jgi:hypothetical protein
MSQQKVFWQLLNSLQPLNHLNRGRTERGTNLDRLEAMAMLKELVAKNLVEPSFVSISERKPNNYQIQIKSDYNRVAIEEYAKVNGLTIEEGIERKYLLIFKP